MIETDVDEAFVLRALHAIHFKVNCSGRRHAFVLSASARERREGGVGEKVCREASASSPADTPFSYFSRGNPRVLRGVGDGAPPQARIHLNLGGYHSGSPHTKFGHHVTVCNRHEALFTKPSDTL